MAYTKRLVMAFFILASTLFLSGCNDKTGLASPDPSVEINKSPGESVTLSAIGPPPSLMEIEPDVWGWTNYYWEIEFLGSASEARILEELISGSTTASYTIPEEGLNTNKIRISCYYFVEEFDIVLDSHTWTIRIDQDSAPIWNGNYLIENKADMLALAGYTTISGDLVIKGSDLENLQGLENISTIGGSLFIVDNPELISIEGLGAVSVAGAITIADNPALLSDIEHDFPTGILTGDPISAGNTGDNNTGSITTTTGGEISMGNNTTSSGSITISDGGGISVSNNTGTNTGSISTSSGD